MAHEARTNADAFYVDGATIPRATFEDIDLKQFRSINGDRGGCWAPAGGGPINIAGSGLVCTGPVEVRGDGVLYIGDAIRLDDNDFPELAPGHAGRSRVLLQSTLPFVSVGPYPWAVTVHPRHLSAQPICLTIGDDADGVTPAFVVPLRVHDGAALDKIVFSYRVPELRASGPVGMPRFRVFRRDKFGVVSTLRAADDGYASPANPGSSVAWFANGAAQTFEYVCDQNATIDIAQYTYFAHVVEESRAAKYPARLQLYNNFTIFSTSTGLATDTMPDGAYKGKSIYDGVDSGYGDFGTFIHHHALADGSPHPLNGVYHSGASSALAWTRPAGFDTGVAITESNGTLFLVTLGGTRSGVVLQMTVNPTRFAVDKSPIGFAPPVAHGNVYLPFALHFSGIVDTRWQ